MVRPVVVGEGRTARTYSQPLHARIPAKSEQPGFEPGLWC